MRGLTLLLCSMLTIILVTFCLGCGRDGTGQGQKSIDPVTFDRAVKDFVEAAERSASGEITKQQLQEKAAWFKPYYGQLVHVPDPYVWMEIIARHEPWYSVRNLEPMLRTEKGKTLKFVAIAIWGFSFGLHPGARDTLLAIRQNDLAIGHNDPDVNRCLSWETSVPIEARETVRYHQRQRDEAARQQAGVPVDEWKTLSSDQKWERLRTAWFGRNHITSSKSVHHEE